MLEGLLGRGGRSLQGLAGSLEEVLSGSPAPEGSEGGPLGEAAAYEEEEVEDIPPPYDEVVGSGPAVLSYGPTDV